MSASAASRDQETHPVDAWNTGSPLTLSDCIRIALHGNPDVHVALARIRQGEAALAEANAALYPVLNFQWAFLRADAPSQYLFKTIDARNFSPGTDFNHPGAFTDFETALGLHYNLFNGGRNVLGRWAAQTGVSIQEVEVEAVRNGLVAGVIQGYYEIRASDERLRTAQTSVQTVTSELEETKAKFAAGNALRSDVLSLEVRLAEAKEQAIRAENARSLAVAGLANLLGGDADTAIDLGDEDWDPGDLPADYDSALAEALISRPELIIGRRRIEQASMGATASERAYWPQVDAVGRLYWNDEGMDYELDNRNWLAGVALRWDLLEGGQRRAGVLSARSLLDQLLESDRKTTLAVQLDVKTAYLRIQEARARLEVTRVGRQQAEENLELVRTQFEGGAATVTRYLEAESMLTRARMRNTNANYEWKKAQADAARALGRLSLTSDELGSTP